MPPLERKRVSVPSVGSENMFDLQRVHTNAAWNTPKPVKISR